MNMGRIIDKLIHDNEKEEYDELMPILSKSEEMEEEIEEGQE